jgi:hypothetical protein
MNIDPVPLAAWATLASILVTSLGFLIRYERRLTNRLDKQDTDLADLKSTLTREFSGNSGGIREAINALKEGQKQTADRIDAHLQFHAYESPDRRDTA